MSGREIGAVIVIAVAVGVAAYLFGRSRSMSSARPAAASAGKRLEEYDFYPFVIDASGHVDFDPAAFSTAVLHFLDEPNGRAAREPIVVGDQNLVRDTFPSDGLDRYKELYAR